jgi:hypothetical protein
MQSSCMRLVMKPILRDVGVGFRLSLDRSGTSYSLEGPSQGHGVLICIVRPQGWGGGVADVLETEEMCAPLCSCGASHLGSHLP